MLFACFSLSVCLAGDRLSGGSRDGKYKAGHLNRVSGFTSLATSVFSRLVLTSEKREVYVAFRIFFQIYKQVIGTARRMSQIVVQSTVVQQ